MGPLSSFFFSKKVSRLTLLAMLGEDKEFDSVATDGDIFKIAAHGDSLYLMNLATHRYTMNVLITALSGGGCSIFFPFHRSKSTEMRAHGFVVGLLFGGEWRERFGAMGIHIPY